MRYSVLRMNVRYQCSYGPFQLLILQSTLRNIRGLKKTVSCQRNEATSVFDNGIECIVDPSER